MPTKLTSGLRISMLQSLLRTPPPHPQNVTKLRDSQELLPQGSAQGPEASFLARGGQQDFPSLLRKGEDLSHQAGPCKNNVGLPCPRGTCPAVPTSPVLRSAPRLGPVLRWWVSCSGRLLS